MSALTLQFVLCSPYSVIGYIALFWDCKLETTIGCHRSNYEVVVGNSSKVIDADNTTVYRSKSLERNPLCELTIIAILPDRSIASLCTGVTQRSARSAV